MPPATPYTASNPSNAALVMWLLLAFAFLALGIYFRRRQAIHILEWDRGWAYRVYQAELRSSGDQDKALAKATKLYRVFGLITWLIAMLHVVLVSGKLLSRLLGYE